MKHSRLRFQHRRAVDVVAIILASGISLGLLLVAAGSLMNTVRVEDNVGDHITQILTGWGGGMVGVLGAYVGYTFGHPPPKEKEKSD